MKKPLKKPYICFPTSFRIPVYSEKDPTRRTGYKSVTAGKKEFAALLKCDVSDIELFNFSKHKRVSPRHFVHFSAKDLPLAFPDEFHHSAGSVDNEESYYGE